MGPVRNTRHEEKISTWEIDSKTQPLHPIPIKTVSVCSMWLDCIMQCVSAEGLGIEAQGVIGQIIVYLNGLPFGENVRMGNQQGISVQNELTGQ